MNFNNSKYSKTLGQQHKLKINKYKLNINKGAYAIFTIDNTGVFNCKSSYGNYNYKWSSFGKDFKEFLSYLREDYLLDKLCCKDYLDIDNYIEKCKKEVLNIRMNCEITKNDARDLWKFFTNEFKNYNSFDFVCNNVFANNILCNLYSNEVYNSNFMPEKDYSNNSKIFVKEVYPKFVEILREEVNCQLP